MTLNEQKAASLQKRLQGFAGYCGIVYDDIQKDHCLISCLLKPELRNPAGMAHGGLIAALLDVASGMMALEADDWTHNIVTQSCSIHYLRPAAGERLWAESRVIRKGNRVCVVRADCFSDDGQLAATSTYEIAYLGMRTEVPDRS